MRTTARAIAAAISLVAGGAVLALGITGVGAGPPWLVWATGVVGSGWVSDSWRGLLDELTLVPLFGKAGGLFGWTHLPAS